jgi:hypothetical protein
LTFHRRTTTGAAAPKLRKDSTICTNSGHTFLRPKGALIIDFALAHARQKFKKVKLFLFFRKKEKNPQNLFFADFWFLACSTWNICK